MNVQNKKYKWIWMLSILGVVFLMAGCVQTAESCPQSTLVDLSGGEEYFYDDQAPFQFPLDDPGIFMPHTPLMTNFSAYGVISRGPEYHAAEDILQPAGTPVYAMADGIVSFSGKMGGYGWLVIVDHPQADIYSLYGHLSPSRWSIKEEVEVQKGELVGYLGDSDENGGTPKNPLLTHLHFGVRVGQRADYPDKGQWRWMAGWVKLCPQDLGWLQPSHVIASQDIHFADSYKPTANLVTIWWSDLLLGSIYLVGSGCVLFVAIRQDKNLCLFISGIVITAAGLYFETVLRYVLFFMAGLMLCVGLYRQFARSDQDAAE